MTNLDKRSLEGTRAERLLATLERLLAIEAVELRPALTEASQLLAEVLRADKVDVFLFDAARDALVAAGTSDTPMGRRQHALGLHVIPLAWGGRDVETYRTGTPFLTGHSEADPREVPGIPRDLGVRSSLLVPLDVQGERRGVLSAVSAQPDWFDPADLDFLQAAARWIGSLTHRVGLAEQMRTEAAAQARQQTADELISVLAHDLRTPLTPLFGYAEMIRTTAERDGQLRTAQAAASMLRGLRRLQRMIGDLLDASRLERGLFAVAPEQVDLVQLVRQAIDSVGLTEPDIAVEAPDALCAVVDPARVQQALENLLSNARRYAPAGTVITVRVAAEGAAGGEWAVITVQDRGPGIAPDLLPHLFSRFQRGAGSPGLGLGLFLAHGIATAHGGTLQVESRPGAGTTFHLRLPCAGPAGDEDHPRAAEPA
jgi:signal transduction histidine kinase